MTQPLILASTSPYKKMLLERLQLEFSCRSPQVDETPHNGEHPSAMAQRLAEQKALAVATKFPNALVIGADQVADLNGKTLGKPGNHQRAVAQLRAQSGQKMKFHCAISVVQQLSNGKILKQTRVNTTEVQFRTLNQQQIDNYLHSDQPYDCAGSFKVEALGISLFSSVNSNDPSSLIGLPLIDLCSILADYGVDIH
ncbi:MAG: Maf family nucleotide pyrophosphatase [Porticoccaceae bacterium]|jgi:septum formation protein|nr:Maf family nucleotide pyrophosphatase [Porticoccaceae bacterium]